jgi:hypothetical protein
LIPMNLMKRITTIINNKTVSGFKTTIVTTANIIKILSIQLI